LSLLEEARVAALMALVGVRAVIARLSLEKALGAARLPKRL
jgi:hypothetical protein